jgi:hypothetical protein
LLRSATKIGTQSTGPPGQRAEDLVVVGGWLAHDSIAASPHRRIAEVGERATRWRVLFEGYVGLRITGR